MISPWYAQHPFLCIRWNHLIYAPISVRVWHSRVLALQRNLLFQTPINNCCCCCRLEMRKFYFFSKNFHFYFHAAMIQQKKVLNELLLMISIDNDDDDDEENRIVESRNFFPSSFSSFRFINNEAAMKWDEVQSPLPKRPKICNLPYPSNSSNGDDEDNDNFSRSCRLGMRHVSHEKKLWWENCRAAAAAGELRRSGLINFNWMWQACEGDTRLNNVLTGLIRTKRRWWNVQFLYKFTFKKIDTYIKLCMLAT